MIILIGIAAVLVTFVRVLVVIWITWRLSTCKLIKEQYVAFWNNLTINRYTINRYILKSIIQEFLKNLEKSLESVWRIFERIYKDECNDQQLKSKRVTMFSDYKVLPCLVITSECTIFEKDIISAIGEWYKWVILWF